MDGPLSWIVFAVVVLGGLVAAVLYIRSLRNWRPTQGGDPEARQAEARLWSTLNTNRR
jgi:hypothetical protein